MTQAYAKILVGAAHHPKMIQAVTLDRAAPGLWAMGMCYAQNYLTDGFIPHAVIPGIIPCLTDAYQSASALVEAGLWHVVQADGRAGFQINDYLDHNRSKSEIEKLAETKRKAAAKGGKAKARNRAKRSEIRAV